MKTRRAPQARRTREVLIAGDANVDLLLHDAPPLELDTEKLAKGMDLTLGGSSSITAFNLARLGTRVGFISVLGDDLFGRFVAERLSWAGVHLEHLKWLPDQKSGLTIWHIRGARRAGVTYEGTISLLRASDIPDGYLAKFRHLHVGAYFLGKNLHAGAPALFRRARRVGLTTSLDCNYDPAGKWDSGIRAVLKETDVFFPNEDEAKHLTGQRDVRGAARELAKLARIVAIKRGARGVLVQSAAGVFERQAPRVKAVDGTGAGDSFDAGFLSRFVRGRPLEECAQAGIEAGARAVTRMGGTTAFE
jgi:sugar/nucleoside kinase (ribokinase family)